MRVNQIPTNYLGISCHSETNESFIKRWRVASGDVEWFVLEDVFLHLIGHLQLRGLRQLLPPEQVARLLVDGVESLVELPCLLLLQKVQQFGFALREVRGV